MTKEKVTSILYDQYGQRTKIEYGNGVVTEYEYDPARRWLSAISTENKWGVTYQNITYSFDRVGNVLGYENNCLDNASGNYKTAQSYAYDNLYQLISVDGTTTYDPHRSQVPEFKSDYSQVFTFDSDGLGNMVSKVSTETVTPQKSIGDNLNYSFDYVYDENYAHRLLRAGERYYKYDSNGNVVCEQDGAFDNNGSDTAYYKITQESADVYSTDYGWGLFKDSGGKTSTRYSRTYTWNERNQLVSSVDSAFATNYIYGQDGERSNKYTEKSETLYFNKMWTLHTDSGNATHGGQTAKNIYLGDTRIVTKLNSGSGATFSEENAKQYFYHSDYLGSASLISDKDGNEYQRIEYTPYGETWVEKTQNTGLEWLPYKFTAKEMDEETGLYYYGARYLDPKYSRWLSTDPAMSDYMAGSDAGGGAYNATNFSLYNYGNNNPVKYTDPDGRITQHKDLKGSDRAKAELKDIVQCSLKYGLFASISATVWEVLNIGAEVDAGSVEVSGSLNDDVKTTESAGIGIELGVLDFLKGKLSVEKSRELPDGEEFDDFTQVLKDIYTKGEVSPDIEASIGPLSTSAADEDVKVGVEAGLGVGIGMWINLSEIKDFFKGWINGDY